MLILELKLRKLRFGEEKTKVVNKYLEKEHGNRRTGTKGDEDNEVGKKRKRLCGIMRWGELGDLAVLLCSLTKVWISQRSTVTLQPSSSRSGRTTRSQSTNKESESVMAERACLPPSLSITANTRRWERERETERERKPLTTALTTSWWWGHALWLTLRTSGYVWPQTGHEQGTFTVCVQSPSSVWLVQLRRYQNWIQSAAINLHYTLSNALFLLIRISKSVHIHGWH